MKTSYHIETNQMICKANQLTDFYTKWVCPERYLRTYCNRSRIMFTSLGTVSNSIILKSLLRFISPVKIVMSSTLSLWSYYTGNVLSCNVIH